MTVYIVHLKSESGDNYYLSFSYHPSSYDIDREVTQIVPGEDWDYVNVITIKETELITR